MSFTTDKNDPELNEIKDNGQNKKYLILSEDERAKGFVRPVRQTYVHKGRLFDKGIEILEEPYVADNGKTYVAIVTVLVNEDGTRKGGTYITQDELHQYNNNDGFVGGCGTVTTMSLALAETYARDPNFYGATFCTGCSKHIGVHEFVWEDGEMVGS